MKKIKPDNYTQSNKLVCDWTDKKKYLIHYRMVKFFVRYGMVVEKIHVIISYLQSKWLEKLINFISQKRNLTKKDFEKGFYKLFNNSFYVKPMENVRNRLRLELINKDDNKNFVKQQSKLTFNGIHQSYEICDSYTFEQNEVYMDKPIYLGFGLLELSKILIYMRHIILNYNLSLDMKNYTYFIRTLIASC